MFYLTLHFVEKKIVDPPQKKIRKKKKNHVEIADFYIECHCEFKAFFLATVKVRMPKNVNLREQLLSGSKGRKLRDLTLSQTANFGPDQILQMTNKQLLKRQFCYMIG